jgi:hypothetical protein
VKAIGSLMTEQLQRLNVPAEIIALDGTKLDRLVTEVRLPCVDDAALEAEGAMEAALLRSCVRWPRPPFASWRTCSDSARGAGSTRDGRLSRLHLLNFSGVHPSCRR